MSMIGTNNSGSKVGALPPRSPSLSRCLCEAVEVMSPGAVFGAALEPFVTLGSVHGCPPPRERDDKSPCPLL